MNNRFKDVTCINHRTEIKTFREPPIPGNIRIPTQDFTPRSPTRMRHSKHCQTLLGLVQWCASVSGCWPSLKRHWVKFFLARMLYGRHMSGGQWHSAAQSIENSDWLGLGCSSMNISPRGIIHANMDFYKIATLTITTIAQNCIA